MIIDNSWAIDAYNFQIYSKNNNCILSITNDAGNGFTANIKDYTTPKGANVYAYIWNLMREASSEITVHSDGGIFREISYQPQTVNHGTNYTENSFGKYLYPYHLLNWKKNLGRLSKYRLARNRLLKYLIKHCRWITLVKDNMAMGYTVNSGSLFPESFMIEQKPLFTKRARGCGGLMLRRQ